MAKPEFNRADLESKSKEELIDTVLNIQRQLRMFKLSLFGNRKKSEKNIDLNLEPGVHQLELPFYTEEEKKEVEEKVDQIASEEKDVIEVKSHTRKKHTSEQINISELPVNKVVIEPDEITDENRSNYVKIGEEISRRVVKIPEHIYVEETIRIKYVLKSSLQEVDKNPFVIAPPCWEVFPKSLASASILADILVKKYHFHLPFHRIIQEYKDVGFTIGSSTINDWFNKVCDLLRPIYNELRKKILKSGYVHCDETFIDVYMPDLKKVLTGYLWAICEGNGNNVAFIYELGRKDASASYSILGSYKGALQTDCNSIYNKFDNNPNIVTLACLSHWRRYWCRALDEDEKVASEAIALINKLYSIEHDAIIQKLTPEEKCKLRQEKSVEVFKLFTEWLEKLDLSKYAIKSPVIKAVTYTTKHFDKLSRYICDGRFSADNNEIEAFIRPLKIGLNSYQYFHNHDAAYRSAIIYSLIGTCNANDVNAREWFEDVLPKLARIDYGTEEGKRQLNLLLPDEWKKSHSESHAFVQHMTEEEHIAQILRDREKRKAN